MKASKELLKLMQEKGIRSIELNYSGSGDSGAVDGVNINGTNESADDKIIELVEAVLMEVVDPNFDDSGSSGEAEITINEEGKLHFTCDHRDYYEAFDPSEFDKVID